MVFPYRARSFIGNWYYLEALERDVETGQALDHQSGPGIRAKKKRARPVDTTVRSPPRLGAGLRGRDLVESLCPTQPACLGRGGHGVALGREGQAQRRPGPEGIGLLRPVGEMGDRARAGLAAYGRWSAGECHHHPVLLWCCDKLQGKGVRVLLLVWDNASWHISHEVRNWIRAHNWQVKCSGEGVRILACLLPTKSPWLNPIEPMWVHGKRRVVEPSRTLSAQELADRICATFGCDHETYLAIPEKCLLIMH